MFGRFGWAEILVIVVLVLILFGHNKIPTMMKNLADGLKTFKSEMKSADKDDDAKNAPAKAVAASGKSVTKRAPAKKAGAKKTAAKSGRGKKSAKK